MNDTFLASQALQALMHQAVSHNLGFQHDVTAKGQDYTGDLVFARVRFKVNLEANGDTGKKQSLRNAWKQFVDELNRDAPWQAGKAFMVSKSWTEMELESQVLSSTTTAFIGSMLTSLVAVTVFTKNVVIALYVCANILLVVGMLAGFLLNVMAYPFGVVEAIAATIFVGLSVDYCLHLAHGYIESFGSNSKLKLKHSLVFLGPSIVGGSITTISSCVFLLPCRVVLFRKLGVVLLSNATISVVVTFTFLAPLLIVAGPTGSSCPRCFTRGAPKDRE